MANRCKYEKYQYQVSYDNGSTWENVTPIQVSKGNLIEYESLDCGEIETIYRWVDLEGVYICDGNNKYTKQIQEESYDNGATWYASYPTVYQQGTFVGVDADYCCDKFIGHYADPQGSPSCPPWYKWNGYKCVYVDPLKVVKCNSDPTLTRAETIYYDTTGRLIYGEIGNTVTSIGNGAFSAQTALSAITIPNSITSIGYDAFIGCLSLTSITIPNSVTSIGNNTFYDCSGLTNCTIGSGVTSIGNSAFTNCISLTAITIPDGITTIGEYTFYQCSGLTNCTIGSGVTSIGNSAFTNCISLTAITIPSSVTSIGSNAFRYCSGLTNVTIGSGLTNIGRYAFYRCSSISSITIPSGVTSIQQYAFSGCTSLTSITCLATTPPSLEYTRIPIGEGFYKKEYNEFDNTNNCPIYVPCESLEAYRQASGWGNYNTRILGLPPCEIKYRGRYGGKYYIELCDSSTELTTASTKPSGYDYSYLYNVEIGNCITSFGSNVFDGCTRLSSITIGSGITSIGDYALRDCSGLTYITINATTPPTLGSNALDNTNNCPIYVPCESVASYKLAWSNYSSRIYGEYPCMSNNDKFSALYSNSTVYVGECNNDPTLTMTDVRHGGNEYSSMTDATIGQCVTAIGNYAFSACTSLTSIDISNTVTSIGNDAFYRCSGLTSVAIPNSVTNIGEYAFSNCYGLTSVTIGNGITSIGKGAFLITMGSSSSLQSITINANTPPTLGNDAFYRTNNCPIYVPLSSLNTYKNASGWSAYADRIQAIP